MIIHTYIHTYTHTYIHTYIHTNIHARAYIHIFEPVGVAYQDLVKYLKEKGGKYSVYQPFNVVNPLRSTTATGNDASSGAGGAKNATSLYKTLNTLLVATDSTR